MEERKSIKDILVKSSGYDIALLTTFNYDVRFFERAILNPLVSNNIRTVSVFADSKEFASSLAELNYSEIGRKYIVTPVDIDGAFHPKVALLLGDKKARLIVGSANLTTAGYYRNNEVYNCIDYSEEHGEYQDIIAAAIQFFVRISAFSYPVDSEVIERIRSYSYYCRAKYNGIIRLIHNIDHSLLDQIKEIIDEKIDEIDIAVPYYDTTLSILEQFKDVFVNPRLKLFIQNKTSTFPISEKQKGMDIYAFEQLKDNKSNRFYHAKVFLFKAKDKSYVLYGSANCTKAALSNTASNGGNVECGFLVEGKREEFNYYFDNFDITDRALITNQPSYDADKMSRVFFKYGIVKQDLHLHFGGCDGEAEVLYEGKRLNSNYEGEELVAIIPSDKVDDLPDFFNVIVIEKESEVNVKCWWFDPIFIDEFRNNTSEKSALKSFELESDGDKYIQDRRNIIEAEIACLPDVKTAKKAKALLTPIEDKEVDDIDDEYYVDYDIPEEYDSSYKKQSEVERIRQLYLNRVFSYYKTAFSSKGLSSNKASKQTNDAVKREEPSEVVRRAPTTDDESFERFIRRKLRIILDPDNEDVKEITPLHLFGLIQEFLEVFDKYKNVDLFDPLYVANIRIELFKILLDKDFSEESNEIQYTILLECYKALLNNYYSEIQEKELLYREEYNFTNKKLIDVMSKKYDIRVDYKIHIKDLQQSKEEILEEDHYGAFIKYIEKLFGFKDYGSLVDYIKERYLCNNVIIDNKSCEILARSDNKRPHFIPDKEVLKEIRNYSNNVSRINQVKITIEISNDNHVKAIEHSFDTKSCMCKTDIYYLNGNVISDTNKYN